MVARSHTVAGVAASRSPVVAFGIVAGAGAGSRVVARASSELASVGPAAALLAALAVVAFVVAVIAVRVSFGVLQRVVAGQLCHPTGYQLEAIIVARWWFRSCSRSRANSLGSLSGIAIHRL